MPMLKAQPVSSHSSPFYDSVSDKLWSARGKTAGRTDEHNREEPNFTDGF